MIYSLNYRTRRTREGGNNNNSSSWLALREKQKRTGHENLVYPSIDRTMKVDFQAYSCTHACRKRQNAQKSMCNGLMQERFNSMKEPFHSISLPCLRSHAGWIEHLDKFCECHKHTDRLERQYTSHRRCRHYRQRLFTCFFLEGLSVWILFVREC